MIHAVNSCMYGPARTPYRLYRSCLMRVRISRQSYCYAGLKGAASPCSSCIIGEAHSRLAAPGIGGLPVTLNPVTTGLSLKWGVAAVPGGPLLPDMLPGELLPPVMPEGR